MNKKNRNTEIRDDRRTMGTRRFMESARCGRGASATELIILLVLIALVSVGVFRLFGDTIKSKLTGAQASVSAVGTDEKPRQGGFDGAGASGSSGSSDSASASRATTGGSSGSGSAIEGKRGKTSSSSTAVAQKAAKPGSVGGFNPWIMVIFVGLAGLLVYVFFAKKSG